MTRSIQESRLVRRLDSRRVVCERARARMRRLLWVIHHVVFLLACLCCLLIFIFAGGSDRFILVFSDACRSQTCIVCSLWIILGVSFCLYLRESEPSAGPYFNIGREW